MLQPLNCHSLEDKHRLVMMYKITNENYITEKDRLKPSLGCIPNLSLSLLVLSCKTRERQESFSLVQFLTGTVCHGLESPIETSNDAVFFYQLMKTVFTFFQLSCVTSDIIFNFCRVSIGRFRIMCYFCIIYHCLKDIFLSCYI